MSDIMTPPQTDEKRKNDFLSHIFDFFSKPASQTPPAGPVDQAPVSAINAKSLIADDIKKKKKILDEISQ